MLLFHATAVLGAVALAERGIVQARIGSRPLSASSIAAGLFAGDLTLRQYAGHGLFPMAAPTGGTLLIVSWLALAVAAAGRGGVTPCPDERSAPGLAMRSAPRCAALHPGRTSTHFAPCPPIG